MLRGSPERYLDFPILRDEDTIKYVRNNKLMVILKGLPGSGKTTIAKNIKKIYPDTVICSADYYFVSDGLYKKDKEKLNDAHTKCQQEANYAMIKNANVIVIDNTNIRHWQSVPYLKLCKKYKYLVLYIEPQTPWCFDTAELAVKTDRKLGEDFLTKMLNSYQANRPTYYAWFFNELDSNLMKKIAWQWLKTALSEVNEFEEDFLQLTQLKSLQDILEYFQKAAALHVTAMFSNRGKSPGAMEYINNPLVKQSMGKCYPISTIGYVITPYTFGARVQLTKEELELWGQKASSDQNPKGSCAHITLGTAPGVKPFKTYFDLMDVISCERTMKNVPTYKLSKAVLKCYGDGRWVIYPETKVVVESFFSAYY